VLPLALPNFDKSLATFAWRVRPDLEPSPSLRLPMAR
jgi:hypothetical protein